ncbi:MAG TPA: translation initiation factor IF-2 [Spirochaetota bacterium]|nr:translation initiation factor IF-2 [Spirochaetota bacterium]
MKAIDIATTNHVTEEDILTICKDLGISCAGMDAEFSERDVFLVQKKIEVIKEQRAKAARELLERKNERSERPGAKIKLKRKVTVSKELIKEKQEKDEEAAAAPPAVTERKEEAPKAASTPPREERRAPAAGRPAAGRSDQRPDSRPAPRSDAARRPGPGAPGARPFGDRRPGPGAPGARPFAARRPGPGAPPPKDAGAADKKDEAISAKEKEKRKKAKEKEKEKEGKKSLYKDKGKRTFEKSIFSRRKKGGHHAGTQEQERVAVSPKNIDITESVSVGDLAKKLNVKASEVISRLMKLGMMATINQVIDAETAEILASEFGTVVRVVSLFEETVIRQEEEDRAEDRSRRPPIVTVMGHVDHGKTKLLDAIRKTNVVDGEYGGITQHIGAYTVKVRDQFVTFLDTPGHEAFTTMRARGARVTDIVILVVAANDGVMPQTVEAINHAKAAHVPIIVAINKIDIPETNITRIRQDLSNYDLAPEEWGGTTLYAEVSAKQMINIEELLDLILIQAEMLELDANPALLSRGVVIESRLDPGRGPVATALVQNGTLHVGDPFVVGIYSGKVRAMFNDQGQPVQEAGPSTPVELVGLSGVPSAGDPFQVVESEKYSKQISQKRIDLRRLETAKKVRKVTLEDLNEMIREGEVQELRVVIKADVDGSVQALKESLEKLSTGDVRVKVIHAGTGGINESDVMLASASNAIIIGYHVRPTARVSELAEKESVSIKFFNIIFEVTDSIRAAMEGMLSPEYREEVVGSGEVRQIFKISRLGTVAGAIVLSGKVNRKNRVRIIRDGVVVFDGELKSLKRFKDDVSEVDSGQECGFGMVNYNDLKEGDTFEAYRTIEIAKTLDG